MIFEKPTIDYQKRALDHPDSAYYFALRVPGADIARCQQAVLNYPQYAYYFARYISGADIQKSLDACKGTKYESMLNQYLMESALL